MLVSIIIPMYNSEKYISKCINAILNQSFNNFEVIIIDDGSNDNSKKIVEFTIKDDNRFKMIYQKNLGVSEARNVGIHNAKGKYIIFIDSDDWIEKNYIEKLVNNIEEKNADFAWCDWMVHEHKKKYRNCISSNLNKESKVNDLIIHFINSRSGGAPWGKIYLKEIINNKNIKFKSNIPYAEDYLFNLEFLAHAQKVVYINEALINYNCLKIGEGSKKREDYDEIQLKVEKLKEKIISEKYCFDNKYDTLLNTQYFKVCCLSIINTKNLNLSFEETKSKINDIINKFNIVNRLSLNKINLGNLSFREIIMYFLIKNKMITLLTLIIMYKKIIKIKIKI